MKIASENAVCEKTLRHVHTRPAPVRALPSKGKKDGSGREPCTLRTVEDGGGIKLYLKRGLALSLRIVCCVLAIYSTPMLIRSI